VYLHLRVIKSYLIWTSLCMLFEVVTIDLHYMTDRQEQFDLKISKLKRDWCVCTSSAIPQHHVNRWWRH